MSYTREFVCGHRSAASVLDATAAEVPVFSSTLHRETANSMVPSVAGRLLSAPRSLEPAFRTDHFVALPGGRFTTGQGPMARPRNLAPRKGIRAARTIG